MHSAKRAGSSGRESLPIASSVPSTGKRSPQRTQARLPNLVGGELERPDGNVVPELCVRLEVDVHHVEIVHVYEGHRAVPHCTSVIGVVWGAREGGGGGGGGGGRLVFRGSV